MSIIQGKSITLDYVMVIEGVDSLANLPLFVVDAFYKDRSVLNIGIFSGLESACREGCSVAYAAGCHNVRVCFPSELKGAVR